MEFAILTLANLPQWINLDGNDAGNNAGEEPGTVGTDIYSY